MKKEEPLFSIIVPVYNAAHFVRATIDNLLRQDVNKEILLINDGSTDESLQIIREYEQGYDSIKVIDKTNGGVSSARNIGLDTASGDFVIFVDSDDFIENGLLRKCLDIFEKYNPDSIYFSYKYVFPHSSKTDISFHYKATGFYSVTEWIDELLKLWNTHIISCIGSKIYRKSILDKYHIRFNESISYLEDCSFAIEYLGHTSNLYYIDLPYYHYRLINEISLMTMYRISYLQSSKFLQDQLRMFWENVYGVDSDFSGDYYRIIGDNILDCVNNLITHKKESFSVIGSDLSELSDMAILPMCIKYARSVDNKLKLLVLKRGSQYVIKKYFGISAFYQNFKYSFKSCLKKKMKLLMQ